MCQSAWSGEAGVRLFAREGRGKRLTAAGARLAAKAAGILEGARRLKEDVAGEPIVPRGHVRGGEGAPGREAYPFLAFVIPAGHLSPEWMRREAGCPWAGDAGGHRRLIRNGRGEKPAGGGGEEGGVGGGEGHGVEFRL